MTAEEEEHAHLVNIENLSTRAHDVASEVAAAQAEQTKHIQEAEQASHELDVLDKELNILEDNYSERAHAENHVASHTAHSFFAKPHAHQAFAMPFPLLPSRRIRRAFAPLFQGSMMPVGFPMPNFPVGASFEMTISAVPSHAPQRDFSWPVVHGMLNDPVTESLATSLQMEEDDQHQAVNRAAASSAAASLARGMTNLVRELVSADEKHQGGYAQPARLEVVSMMPVEGGMVFTEKPAAGFAPIFVEQGAEKEQETNAVCEGCEFA